MECCHDHCQPSKDREKNRSKQSACDCTAALNSGCHSSTVEADNLGSPYAVGDGLDTGRLAVVGLGMADVDVEEVDMPMGEAGEDD